MQSCVNWHLVQTHANLSPLMPQIQIRCFILFISSIISPILPAPWVLDYHILEPRTNLADIEPEDGIFYRVINMGISIPNNSMECRYSASNRQVFAYTPFPPVLL